MSNQIIIRKPRGRPPKNKENFNNHNHLDNIKILSWNVNGIRSILKDHVKVFSTLSFEQYLDIEDPTIICFTETKISKTKDVENVDKNILKNYSNRYWNCSKVKHGYSGTAIFSKIKPLKYQYGFSESEIDQEGRIITLFFEKFILVNVYTPNSGEGLIRLDFRVNEWDLKFRNHINNLEKLLPVIICGDLNCAYKEIDIHNPKSNLRNSGFTIEERNSFDLLLNNDNLIDTFRMFYPNEKKYTFWSFMRNSREKNIGWRIDYFLISQNIKNNILSSEIEDKVLGSDHAPIILKLKI